MLSSKYSLITSSILIFGVAQAKVDGRILRDTAGNIRYMNRYEASGVNPKTGKKERLDVCEAVGKGRLATGNDLATLAQAWGAKLVSVIEYPNRTPEGYYRVQFVDPDGRKSEFYFSHENYRRPDGDLGNNFFWSSSTVLHYPDTALVLNGNSGGLAFGPRSDYNSNAVLCMGSN